MIKANTGKHEMQAPHTAEECRQNDGIHAHPDTACEHPVMSGPGVDLVDSNAPGNDDTMHREDGFERPDYDKKFSVHLALRKKLLL